MNYRTGNREHPPMDFAPALKPTRNPGLLCKKLPGFLSCLLVMVLTAGCASTKVTGRDQMVTQKLPRPAHIWVYDFVASASNVPVDSELSEQAAQNPTPQTAEEIAEGRKLGAQVAAELVEQISEMGLPAEQAYPGTTPQVNDIVLRGYFLSIQKGSEAKRLTIGFSSGESELKTAVEGFQMTDHGLRMLGSGTLESGGSKTPGMGVGLASMLVTHSPVGLIVTGAVKVHGEVSGSNKIEGRAKATAKEIADVLKKRFEQEGWIE
jgi:hypothetical protein